MLRLCTIAALFAIALAGCSPSSYRLPTKPLREIAEIPGANLPVSMRLRNWTDSRGSGSCVIASSCFNHNWVGDSATARHWRQIYAGGQTETSIKAKHDAARIPYYYTRTADRAFLEWVTRTRRSALIWYYPSHCVNFVGLHRDSSRPTDPRLYAWLCDNNRPTRYIRVPVDEFLRNWASYGGFALSRESPPAPPPLYDAIARDRT